jgi:hypothetical protein
MEDLGVDGRTMIKMLHKDGWKVWTGFIWLTLGSRVIWQ